MTLEETLEELACAVALQPGLIAGAVVDRDGNVDTLGAYGYATNAAVKRAVNELRELPKSKARRQLDLVAEITDAVINHCIETFPAEHGMALLGRICAYSDGRTLNDGEMVRASETPAQRSLRVIKGLRAGNLPPHPGDVQAA